MCARAWSLLAAAFLLPWTELKATAAAEIAVYNGGKLHAIAGDTWTGHSPVRRRRLDACSAGLRAGTVHASSSWMNMIRHVMTLESRA